MTEVTDNAHTDGLPKDSPELPASTDPLASIEVYETEGGMVVYDAENPLAWLKASNARPISECR